MRSLLLVATAALCAAGCQRDAHRRAEAERLRSQIRALRALVEDDKAPPLLPPDRLVVGVRQELVRDLLQRRLPLETAPMPGIHLRLESAAIAFEGGESLVTVQGRAHDDGDTFANVTLFGGLHRFHVDTQAGVVSARVAVSRVDVWRDGTGPAERALLTGVNEALRGPGLAALSEMLPPVEMPVRLDPVLDFPGVAGAALEIPPRRLPVDVTVERVIPVARRLWLSFDVKVRP